MAERRMFAKAIIDSDAFLDMPQTSQNLYFHLAMRADDDGFVNNPRKICRMTGNGDDDLKILFAKRFILGFETGLIVIKHWKIHNYIRGDRYKPTTYIEEFSRLKTSENGAYTEAENLGIPDDNHLVYQVETQVRLGKVRLGKDSIRNICTDSSESLPTPSKRFTKPTLSEVKAYCEERKNSVNPQKFIDYYESKGWKIGRNAMKDWKAAVRTWESNDFTKPLPIHSKTRYLDMED